MNKNKKILVGVLTIVAIIVLVITIIVLNKKNNVNNASDIDMNINTDNGDEKIDWSIYEEDNITLTESIVITENGIYNLTGTINGNITVKTTGNVKLILNNVNITSNDGPAIYIEEANDAVICLKEGTTNKVEDSSNYSNTYIDVDGTVFSKSDLTLEGTGTLIVKSNYLDAIVSKDDLKIKEGTYQIESRDDGIRGKDSVYILGGLFDITSSGDGIKSTNDTDIDKGFIMIESGIFNITSELDGIDTQTKLLIKNGEFNITTGGGSSNSSTKDNWGMWGRNPYHTSTNTLENSAKGLKSSNNLVIEDGTFNLDTSDDAIHSNNYIGILNGNITISSGDDGIHADTELIIENGNINITKSYEGIESAEITINNGNINVVAIDDGVNVAGGMDNSATDRRGANNYNNTFSNNTFIMNDGILHINAVGDGIDINGNGYIYGGIVTVEGPTDSANGTLDYDREFKVYGGTFIGSGSSGMLQSISSESNQYNITIYFKNNIYSTDKITITNSNNNEILNYNSSKTYNSIVLSSPNFQKDNSYTIKINNEYYETFTIEETTTTVGRSTGMGLMMPERNQKPSGRY